MKTIYLLLIPTILLIIVIFIKSTQSRVEKEVINKIGKDKIIAISSNANFFGQYSARIMQIRGNGALVLSETEIYFQMWIPKKIIRIPLEYIKNIEKPKFYLGKTVFRPLLKVTFINENNEEDSCAWIVNNLDDWMKRLNELVRK